MSIWKLITKNYTLEDDRDVMARIGLRFVLCTGPYFLLATIAASLGSSVFFALWPALFCGAGDHSGRRPKAVHHYGPTTVFGQRHDSHENATCAFVSVKLLSTSSR